MTIEFSLRQRAIQARRLAILWLSLAVVILVGTYLSLPLVANKTVIVVSQIEGQPLGIRSVPVDAHVHFFAMGILALCFIAVSFTGFLLARSALIESESAARFIGLADALCIAGNDVALFEKAAAILVPQAKHLSVPELFVSKDLKTFTELLKQLRQ